MGLVLDANWRWVHNVGGYQNCFTQEGWNPEFCPDPETCKENCALEGVTAAGQGVRGTPNSMNLYSMI